MADRDCENCKHYTPYEHNGEILYACSEWNCHFEPKHKNEGLYTEITIKKYSHDANGNIESADETTYYVDSKDNNVVEQVIDKFSIAVMQMEKKEVKHE